MTKGTFQRFARAGVLCNHTVGARHHADEFIVTIRVRSLLRDVARKRRQIQRTGIFVQAHTNVLKRCFRLGIVTVSIGIDVNLVADDTMRGETKVGRKGFVCVNDNLVSCASFFGLKASGHVGHDTVSPGRQ